jgi:hypothetical protein
VPKAPKAVATAIRIAAVTSSFWLRAVIARL